MGIAKNIEAYTIYDNYHENIDKFIKDMSEKLNADFTYNRYDKYFEIIGDEDCETSFGKQKRYKLSIEYEEFTINGTIRTIPIYDITIPIEYEYEDHLNLIFYPNRTLQITFLTFEHLWSSFIDELRFCYDRRQESIKKYETLRIEYASILNKIGIGNILIATHAYYHLEGITSLQTLSALKFSDIIKVATEEDNLSIFDLRQVLITNKKECLDSLFLKTPNLNIAFIDTLVPI